MNILNDIQLDFSDVLIQPKRSNLNSRSQVNLTRTFKSEGLNPLHCTPICISNMGTVGTTTMARKIVSCSDFICTLEKHINVPEIISLYYELMKKDYYYYSRVAVSVGVNEDLDNLHKINRDIKDDNVGSKGIPIINIDIANGYIKKLVDRVKQIRKEFPYSWIIAGNVVTPDIVQDLLNNGANIVKVGIGNGSACLTRLKTGVGRPQLSTIIECADAAHQLNGYIMADGGCNCVGDLCKAFCGGADFVMSGSMFAGTDEAEGEIVEIDGKKYKQYYGMSSNLAQEKHFGGVKNYRTSEGREVYIPYTGSIQDVVTDICGGLASCCTYIGSHCIKHMSKHTTFYRVNNQLNTKFANCKTI